MDIEKNEPREQVQQIERKSLNHEIIQNMNEKVKETPQEQANEKSKSEVVKGRVKKANPKPFKRSMAKI